MKRFSADWIKERISVSCFNLLFVSVVCIVLLVFLWLACQDSASVPCVLMQSLYRMVMRDDPSEVVEQIRTQPAPTASFSRCPGGPPSLLEPDDRAIQLRPGHIKLRSTPDTDGDNIIGQIEKCNLLTVLEGPKCADGYNFYKVHPDQSEVGWAAESNPVLRKYWLVSVLDDTECNLPPIFVPNETAVSDHPSSGFIRKEPALSANTLPWNIVDGDSVKILEGPVCNDSYLWYRVTGKKHPEPGWAQLGEGNDYWFDIPERIKPFNVEDADASC